MGISGHILGERKLRRLCERTGLKMDRAFIRGRQCEGRRILGGVVCIHYVINLETGESWIDPRPIHWTSCPPRPWDRGWHQR